MGSLGISGANNRGIGGGDVPHGTSESMKGAPDEGSLMNAVGLQSMSQMAGTGDEWSHNSPSLFGAMVDAALESHVRLKDALNGAAAMVLSKSDRVQKPCLQEREMDASLA